MSQYYLLTNQTAIQSAPPPVVPVEPWGNVLGVTNPPEQTFQLTITGTAGNVSGTAQVVVSNDGISWISYGDPLSVASSYLTGVAGFAGTQSWNFYGAYLTAISGTGAKATLVMSA